MAQDNKIRMPSGQGGLTSFHGDTNSKIEFAPSTVVVLSIMIMVLIILLHQFGGGLIG